MSLIPLVDRSHVKMDLLVHCILPLLVWSFHIKGSFSEGYCRFPEFIWTPRGDESRKWLTETEYVRNTDIWGSQKEVTAKETEMIVIHKVQASCKNKQGDRKTPCHRKGLLYKIVCVAEEHGSKYRVQLLHGDKSQFTCMKFKEINKNVLQVYQAAPMDKNQDILCYDESIERQIWPWISPVQYEWSPCPFSGGFDFGAFVNDKRQVCTRIWRPSRIESECIYGEGLTFLFPDSNCNPFGKKDLLEQRMLCWGDWVEGQFHFVVVGDIGREPQFILRLPHDLDTHEEFPAQIYFSPLAPLTLDGSIDLKIRRLLLRMKRSESGVCYDESAKCSTFAHEGKCTNSALHKYANFCKRSCGLCEFVTSVRAECRFPSSFQGDWELFETDRREKVKITSGEVDFERLGHFICKSKHWSQDHYKLLSVFNNGCRPRYSCAHFLNEGDKLLLYRISRSRLTDESFEMCHFEKDPYPLDDRIRSSHMKILLAKSSIRWGVCGLSGEVRVNATFPDGISCNGKLVDWNKNSCHYRTKLALELEYCKQKRKEEFVCIAHMNIDDNFSVLITQDETGDRPFSCWAIRTYPERMSYKPWDLATKLTRAQCGTQKDMHPDSTPGTNTLIIRTFNDRVQQPCHRGNGRIVIEDIHTVSTPDWRGSTPGPLPVRRTSTPTYHPQHPNNDYPHPNDRANEHVNGIAPRERKSNSGSDWLTPLPSRTLLALIVLLLVHGLCLRNVLMPC